jgi:hypothetical protein
LFGKYVSKFVFKTKKKFGKHVPNFLLRAKVEILWGKKSLGGEENISSISL